MVRGRDEKREQLRWDAVDDATPPPRLYASEDERIHHPEFRDLEFIHVHAKSLINEVPAAAHLPFRYTINVYRGCSHACSYCFARPTHEYLNLDAGRDFESVIVVKVNAVERLRDELQPCRWAGDHIAMGTNTDPCQRCECRYRLTRGVLESLTEARNPPRLSSRPS
jgi:DNA repair photolyase